MEKCVCESYTNIINYITASYLTMVDYAANKCYDIIWAFNKLAISMITIVVWNFLFGI